MARLNYLELPVGDLAATKAFYTAAFGWDFTDFGPSYASTMSGDTDIGLQGDIAEQTAAPLPVIEVLAIFAFPGGRRFHFRDVAGHELAVMQPR